MPDCEISFDISRIDFRATSDLLMASYWGNGRSDELHRRAFANSLCVGAYSDGKQVGFGRAITDRTVFAYLADVIIWPRHRGRGIGTRLVQALIDHPDCKTVTLLEPVDQRCPRGLRETWLQALHRWPLHAARSYSGSLSEESYNPRLLQNRLTGWTRCGFGRSLAWRRVEPSL
jgi:GNAT superfamily N-acetyltransferase